MSYDEKLAARIRKVLGADAEVVEKKMFGGLAFMLRGHMTSGVVGSDLMLRVGAEAYDAALKEPHARPMDFTGKPLKGMVYVDAKGIANDKQLKNWMAKATRFVATLPEKPRGVSKAPKKTVKRATPKSKTEQRAKRGEDKGSRGFAGFPSGTFEFLAGLEKHNDKAWFEAHRDDYQAYYIDAAVAFVEALGPRLQKIAKGVEYAPKVNGSLFRIHRDTRFAKDKTPYKTHLDLWFWDGERRGFDAAGFFLRMTKQKLLLGAGMHHFEKTRLARYREAVIDPRLGPKLAKIVKQIQQAGPYTVGGVGYKKVPRGFDPEHPRAALLLHVGIWAELDTKLPKETHSAAFVEYVLGHWKAMLPLYDWLGSLAD